MTRTMFAAALAIAWTGAPALAQKTGSIVTWGAAWYGQGTIPAPNADFVAVAPAEDHTLALKADGSIVAWGDNYYGQCSLPPPNTEFVAIAAARLYSVGLKADGSILTWGWLPSSSPPNTTFTAISAVGAYVINLGPFINALALEADGSIWVVDYGPVPQLVPNSGFVAIAAGGPSYTISFVPFSIYGLGLKADGSIVGWEFCSFCGPAPLNVPSPNTGFVAIAAGHLHALGLKAGGSIVAWGDNSKGQCSVPAPNTDFVAVAAGHWHSLGLKADGSVVAWGDNSGGQCSVPAPNTGFFAIAASGYRSLALKVGVCYPDCNTGGSLTISDFACFQTRFVLGDPYSDCDADGQLTVQDFGCFQTKFVLGCP